jgi:hypothetical protein
MFKSLRLWCLKQRLWRVGKYDAYLNQVRESACYSNDQECVKIAKALLAEPAFSRTRSWAEYQRLRNAQK